MEVTLRGPAPQLHIVEEAPQAPASHPRTLDEAFRLYAPYVAAIALRLLGRFEEVDDVVQDVFLSAHRSLGALREPAALKGWLATITVRVTLRRLRTRRLRGMVGLGSEYEYATLAQPGFSPEETAMLAETYALLDQLPPAERLAWSLRHLQGESLERVAELIGASLATAKRRIAAAARKLEAWTHA